MTLLMIISSFSAFARNDRDDKPIVRISIGQDRNQDAHRRIQRLEEAVRDLQDMVYDLQDDRRDRIISEHVCVLKTNFDGSFIGKGSTRIEAEANAVRACKKADVSFCERSKQICELSQRQVRR